MVFGALGHERGFWRVSSPGIGFLGLGCGVGQDLALGLVLSRICHMWESPSILGLFQVEGGA